jgi:hypothetical protein
VRDWAGRDATHITAPARDGAGAALAMRAALDDAGIAPSDVDFISAHGTGTVYNDAMEVAAITGVFRRSCTDDSGELDQGRDRSHAGGGRRVRGHHVGAHDHRGSDPADRELLRARPRLSARRPSAVRRARSG